jgi:PAS domain S-box-containing protein
MGTAVDITQLKQVQEELHRVKDRLELAVSGSKACTWDFEFVGGDFSNAQVALNNYWELLGYDGPPPGVESLSSIIEYAVAPEDRARMVTDLQAFVGRDSNEWEREGRIVHRDGTSRWQLSRGVVARDAEGRMTRFTGASIDITDRKLTEKALQDSEERFRRTFENAAVGMILTDLEGRFLEYNARFCEFLGYPGDDLAGRSFVEFMVPGEVERDLDQQQRVVQGEIGSFTRDKRYVRKDGEIVWGNITVSVIQRHADGTPVHVMGILQDITERKALEVEMQRAREAAEAANRAKDEFLANVSHEIRTPMNAILGMTELAIDSAPSEHQRQLLSTVRSAARNLLTIINDLLDFSKIASGRLTLDRADFSLRAAVGDTLRALAVRAHRKGLELLCRVHPEVPDALEGDAGRLRQVLMNLVGNAIKFTPRGEVEVDVEAEPSSGSSVSVIFTVRDTGIGIARDKQAAIFRAFEQEDASTTRRYGGTGLGLTISAQLASLMGGDITVQSAPGCGSTFRFTARFARSARPDSATVSPERLANLRVLVVDDNETNRRILVEWLTSWRMQPTPAGNAAQALAALASAHSAGAPFSVVLLDARMPDTDGVTLAGEIRRRWEASAPRLILLSSEDSAELSALARETGVLAYLLKPVQQSELLEAIWAAMNLGHKVPASALPAGGQPERARPLRVLVAEDNELNVTLLKELLSSRGHLAQFARDGRAALEFALRGEFDLMLVDLHMPELDGFEVVQAIRDHERGTHQHLRIIALTARSSARDRERCLAAGMDEFLAKPIEAAALWAVMERLVADWPIAAPRAVEPGLLDARAILRACGQQAAVLEKLRVVFRRTLPVQRARVRAALASGDLQELREAAHQLVGTVGAFSTVAAGVASTLEDAAIRQDRESCAALVERLGSLCDALLDATVTLSIDSLSL